MVPGRGRCNASMVIGRLVYLTSASKLEASVTTVLLAVVSVKHCPAFFSFFFLSATRRDKGGGPFPHVCILCWLNSDVISATVSIYYIIPSTGSGMTSVHAALMTSLHMRRHA